MDDIIRDFPQFTFIAGRRNVWSPYNLSIYYDARRTKTNTGRLGLLHEIGHATLGHKMYKYDIELIAMEMDAWDVARQLAPKYRVKIDEDHIARTVESYDYWMTKRATCPDCQNFCLQKGRDEYGCFACGSVWYVNWRKDRRVTRRVTERWEHPLLAGTPKLA